MGVQYFSDFIRSKAPNCYVEIPLENFRGKRIAIDISVLAYACYSISIKEVVESTNLATEKPDCGKIEKLTLDKIMANLGVYLHYGITPVIIFDSEAHPLKKAGAKVKRNVSKASIKDKLKEAEDNLYNAEPMFRVQSLIDQYVKYYKQDSHVPFEFMVQLKDILRTVGFPCFSAADFKLETTDAEGVAAALCLTGNDYCAAVYSNDSDVNVYGCNLAITEIYTKKVNKINTHFAKVRSLKLILEQSGLNFEQFRDLCILQGTDFNPNIPNVGAKRSWDYIAKYGSIENMALNGINVSILNYNAVLKIFASTIVKIDIPPPDFNKELFQANGRNTFALYDLRDHASNIADSLNGFNTPNVLQIEIISSQPEVSLSEMTF
jgi:5'-3' exonuclease